jgi:glyoxylase-like metal-dependent hydrolase (beta-lactamase superfamily II)
MKLPVVNHWFERSQVDDDITLIWEPHVVELMRCNIWHVRGTHRDLIVDTGMGVTSLVDAALDLFGKGAVAVATHGHDDHIGSHHEFDEVLVHPAEAAALKDPPLHSLDPIVAWGADEVANIERAGISMADPYLVTALPQGVTLEGFRQKPARVTRLVDEGDFVEIGNRRFEVLHLPGHTPGSIGLWESHTGILFSGDAIYDGPLLDELDESDIGDYCQTMERLLELPVTVVHAGHDPSFGRPRLHQIATDYLARRA